MKNPDAPAVKREAEEDWGKKRWKGGQRRPGDFGRERREFGWSTPGSDAAKVVLLSEVLALRWRGPTPPLRVTSGETGGLYVFEPPAGGHRYTSRAVPAEPKVVKDYAALLREVKMDELTLLAHA